MELKLSIVCCLVHYLVLFPLLSDAKADGIQEVSGSIPLISTKLGSLGTESLEIYGFQGLFVFSLQKNWTA
jgi:hypothetical protein